MPEFPAPATLDDALPRPPLGVSFLPLSRRPATPSLPCNGVGMESWCDWRICRGLSLASDRSSSRIAGTCDLRRLLRQR
jgi:hypothetical protein